MAKYIFDINFDGDVTLIKTEMSLADWAMIEKKRLDDEVEGDEEGGYDQSEWYSEERLNKDIKGWWMYGYGGTELISDCKIIELTDDQVGNDNGNLVMVDDDLNDQLFKEYDKVNEDMWEEERKKILGE